MTEFGRGAWPSKGTGGTLRANGTAPGPFYCLASDPLNQIGLKTWCIRADGRPVRQEYNATFHAVVGIQMLCNGYAGTSLNCDGIFGPVTKEAVIAAQKKAGLSADGVVGQKTMKSLLLPVIKAKSTTTVDWRAVYGILRFEGALDPGAIGYLDTTDWGLAQINSNAHPDVSFAQAFCPSFAVQFIVNYLTYSLTVLNGDIRLAIASYNLGIGGTREWLRLGQPTIWTPSWSSVTRNTSMYIDRILSAHETM